jgi:hypothetical protein
MATNDKNLQSLLGIAGGMMVLSIVFKSTVFTYIALAVCLAGTLSPKLAALIALLWAKVAHVIGAVINTTLLSLVFFLILTPLALARKITAKGPIVLTRTKTDSYFFSRDHKFEKKDLQDMW